MDKKITLVPKQGQRRFEIWQSFDDGTHVCHGYVRADSFSSACRQLFNDVPAYDIIKNEYFNVPLREGVVNE